MERRKGMRAERTGACWPMAGLVCMPRDRGAVRGFCTEGCDLTYEITEPLFAT